MIMNDRDYLCRLIYMFADYMFSDATLVNSRVDIYNSDNEVILSIHVYSNTPDSVEFIKGNAKGSIEAVNVMNSLIDFLRMIHDEHDNPFSVIRRLVSTSR